MGDNRINPYGPGPETAAARSRGVSRGGEAATGRPAGGTSGGGDSLRLTDTATLLRQAEARLKAQPDVDAARVEAIRQRIDAGQYQVDAERLAARLLRFEQAL
ncbi:MAG: flagellar biosynthesis anti-sigma factor FlgM [Chromatiales bacterium]|jgi:negative regulator of flagellin synthesis FlgM|nr:flagellar biosynthesis anti-sigma factor FlgM [Chromatiales bacterium]